ATGDAGGASAPVGHAGAEAVGGTPSAWNRQETVMKDRITVIGNIANVPERRRTAAGDTVVNFRLGANQSYFDNRAGKWVDGETNWYAVSAYRALAEHALSSLHRGERVIVTGTFRLR